MRKAALILTPVLIILVGGFLFFRNQSPRPVTQTTPEPTLSSHFSLPENLEKEAEISLTPRNDKKAVILKINKIPAGITVIEYELSYETKAGLSRGALGKIDVKSGQNTILREILLGTCSKNVCVYDEGVKKVSLTIKFNKSSGQSTGFSQEYEL